MSAKPSDVQTLTDSADSKILADQLQAARAEIEKLKADLAKAKSKPKPAVQFSASTKDADNTKQEADLTPEQSHTYHRMIELARPKLKIPSTQVRSWMNVADLDKTNLDKFKSTVKEYLKDPENFVIVPGSTHTILQDVIIKLNLTFPKWKLENGVKVAIASNTTAAAATAH